MLELLAELSFGKRIMCKGKPYVAIRQVSSTTGGDFWLAVEEKVEKHITWPEQVWLIKEDKEGGK
jgi:hypothetical protein